MAILDEESLLAICAYIDLNPVAAGIAAVPEASPYTSIKTRVEHAKDQGRTEDLQAAEQGSVAGSCASAGMEESLWLCPIEDRRRLDSSTRRDVGRILAGKLSAFGRLHGPALSRGQGRDLARSSSGIFDRLGSSAESWWARLEKLSKGRLLGRFFAASRERLREVATRLGVHHLANLGGCPAR